jgi:signal transduction histidine kinase
MSANADGHLLHLSFLPAPPRERPARIDVNVPPWALLSLVIVLGTLYSLGALLPFWYVSSPEAGVAFFPPAGLTLAFLALTPPRTWPLWLAVVAVAEATVDLTHGQTAVMAAGFVLANTVEPLIGALALRYAVGDPSQLHRNLGAYVGTAVLLGPAVGAAIGATTALLWGGGADWLAIGGRWWVGDALGVLIIATPILAWSRRSKFEISPSVLETGVIVVMATGVTVLPAILWHHPVAYAVMPVLMWAAFRGGTRAVSAAGVGVAFAANWAVVTGHAEELIEGSTGSWELVSVQLFLAITVLAGLTLAIEIADRRRVEEVARAAEADRLESERRALHAADDERRRIVQETHDIVGHGLSVMLLQAGAARRVLDTDVDLARDLLDSMETKGRDASRELDVALRLADGPLRGSYASGLTSIRRLIDTMRSAGMHIEIDLTESQRSVPTSVARSAYRIVQEALTNVAKHAPAANTVVSIQFDADALLVSVEDDGQGRPATAGSDGRGLAGMRDRVAEVAGELEAGSDGSAGFAVRARLPMSSPQ